TGTGFGGIATQVRGLTLVTADGEMLRIDETHNTDLLPGAIVGLGALGVIVEVTLQCVPAFVLHAVDAPVALDDALQSLHSRAEAADHLEFYWHPHTDVALMKTQTRLPESTRRRPVPRVQGWIDETVLANGVFGAFCAVSRVVPAIIPPFNRLAVQLTGRGEYTDSSHRVLIHRRSVRFREMEYAVPAENVVPAFEEVRRLIDQRGWRIEFPVEVRFAAADGLWLSTASGRDSAYIAVHRYWRADPREYFEAVEQIMIRHDGRPHWGKLHTLTAEQLRDRYPHFDDFIALRDRLDPQRLFGNRHLERIL